MRLPSLRGRNAPTAADTGGSDHGRADAHALRAPAALAGSPQRLAAYLARAGQDETMVARAVYRWITANIAYDFTAFRSGRLRRGRGASSAAEEALRRRTAVCDGHAGLFETLARHAGLEAVTVTGQAKGFGYRPGRPFGTPADHAWNAVRLGGRWHLVDCTWGAGAVDAEGRGWQQRFDPFYFLPPPEALIHTHLPEDPAWQLLPRPVGRAAFEALPTLRSGFFAHGLGLNGAQPPAAVDERVSLTLHAPDGVALLARVQTGSRVLPQHCAFVHQAGGVAQVEAVLPRPGRYGLRLFARRLGEAGGDARGGGREYELVYEQALQVRRGVRGRAGFAHVYAAFHDARARLEAPRDYYLPAGAPAAFSLLVPGAEAVAVLAGRHWTHLTRDGARFHGEAPVTRGEVRVAARFPRSGERYQVLLAYQGV